MMSSVAVLVTPPGQGAYSGSKHAFEGLGDALRLELYSFESRLYWSNRAISSQGFRGGNRAIENLFAKISVRSLCPALGKIFLRRKKQQCQIENYAGGLRTSDAPGRRSTAPESTLPRHSQRQANQVEQTLALGQCHGRHHPPKIRTRKKRPDY
jgi:hypothetical protein